MLDTSGTFFDLAGELNSAQYNTFCETIYKEAQANPLSLHTQDSAFKEVSASNFRYISTEFARILKDNPLFDETKIAEYNGLTVAEKAIEAFVDEFPAIPRHNVAALIACFLFAALATGIATGTLPVVSALLAGKTILGFSATKIAASGLTAIALVIFGIDYYNVNYKVDNYIKKEGHMFIEALQVRNALRTPAVIGLINGDYDDLWIGASSVRVEIMAPYRDIAQKIASLENIVSFERAVVYGYQWANAKT